MLGLGTPELLIILAIILLIFGATLLPKLARTLGRTGKELRDGARSIADRGETDCPFCGSPLASSRAFCAQCGHSKQDIKNERKRLKTA